MNKVEWKKWNDSIKKNMGNGSNFDEVMPFLLRRCHYAIMRIDFICDNGPITHAQFRLIFSDLAEELGGKIYEVFEGCPVEKGFYDHLREISKVFGEMSANILRDCSDAGKQLDKFLVK